jgi:hypothetical protein
MSSKKDAAKKNKKLGGDNLKAALLKDDAFKRYKQMVKNIREKYDLDEMLEEAHTLHDGRSARGLKGTNPGPQKIADAALQDGSNRSRMASMYARLVERHDLLEIAVTAAKMHIASEYGDAIPGFRTKGERSAFLDTYVASGVKLLSRIETILKVLENYIKDIDQMHFQLKLAHQTLALVYDKNKEM